MPKILSIKRRSEGWFTVEFDQEIWDTFTKTERTHFTVGAKDEVEAYNIAMRGVWHEQSRTR